jgi:hypothetical protein
MARTVANDIWENLERTLTTDAAASLDCRKEASDVAWTLVSADAYVTVLACPALLSWWAVAGVYGVLTGR